MYHKRAHCWTQNDSLGTKELVGPLENCSWLTGAQKGALELLALFFLAPGDPGVCGGSNSESGNSLVSELNDPVLN